MKIASNEAFRRGAIAPANDVAPATYVDSTVIVPPPSITARRKASRSRLPAALSGPSTANFRAPSFNACRASAAARASGA